MKQNESHIRESLSPRMALRVDQESARIVLLGVSDRPGQAARLFTSLAEEKIPVEVIIQNSMKGGVNDIGFLVKKDSLEQAIQICRQICQDHDAQGVSFDTEIACLSVTGVDRASNPEISANVFSILADAGINIDMILSEAHSIMCVIGAEKLREALCALRAKLRADA